MTAPAGFSVDLIAGEPDVVQPVAFTFDDAGRLWVAENKTYPIRAPEGQGHDTILVFEDTQGNGRFDKRTVFADNLNLVTGIQIGFGGVWVAAAPYLMFIPMADGPEPKPAGPPQILLDGWGYQDTHNTLSTLIWGPDGWLYGGHGVASHSKVGAPGTPDDKRVALDGSIWRFHPTKRVFEVFAEGLTNPWGIDYNDRGQIFATGCVIPHLWHIIQGARYQRPFGQHTFPFTYDDIKTIADHNHWSGENSHAGREGYRDANGNLRAFDADMASGGGHAHAGGMIYLGGSWPAQYRDQIFMFNLHGHRVNEDILERAGSGYVAHHGRDFLFANDPQSLWLNLQYGPDGSVFAIDFYEKNICHTTRPDFYDRSNGRIYRISYGSPNRKKVDLQNASDQELVELQLNENDWFARHARRILQERGANPKVHQALRQILKNNKDETRRLRALWGLRVTAGVTRELAMQLLSDRSEYVRAWTIQLLCEDRDLFPEALEKVGAMAHEDDSAVVRLYIFSALQRLPLEKRWTIYKTLLDHDEDANDHNIPMMAWFAGEPLTASDPSRALGLALETKLPNLLNFTTRRIAEISTPEARELIADTLSKTTDPQKQLAMLTGFSAAVAGQKNVPAPNAWSAAEEKLGSSPDKQVRILARNLSLTFGSKTALRASREVLADNTADTEERRSALGALLNHRDPELPPILRALMNEPTLHAAAIRALASYNDPETPAAILKVYASLSPAEQRDALMTLASHPNFATELLTAVSANRIPAKDLSASLVRQLRALNQPEINAQLEKLWGVARESSGDKAIAERRVRALIENSNLPAPNPVHGRQLFAQSCGQCHTLYNEGGKVGPDLTGSNRRDLDYLLHNILDPNAEIPNAYRATVFDLKDDRTVVGIIAQEDANTISVATPNETTRIARDDIKKQTASDLSLMPEGLLAFFNDDEIRDLVSYLRSAAPPAGQ